MEEKQFLNRSLCSKCYSFVTEAIGLICRVYVIIFDSSNLLRHRLPALDAVCLSEPIGDRGGLWYLIGWRWGAEIPNGKIIPWDGLGRHSARYYRGRRANIEGRGVSVSAPTKE